MAAPKFIAACLILALRAPSALASDQGCWIPAVAMMCGLQYPTLRPALSENTYWENSTGDQWNKIDNDPAVRRLRIRYRMPLLLCEHVATFKVPVDAFGNRYYSSQLVETLINQNRAQLDALGPLLDFYNKALPEIVTGDIPAVGIFATQPDIPRSLSSRGICGP